MRVIAAAGYIRYATILAASVGVGEVEREREEEEESVRSGDHLPHDNLAYIWSIDRARLITDTESRE